MRELSGVKHFGKRVQRWLVLRCDHCGHRFRWKRDHRSSFGNRDGKVWHGPCIAYVQWHRTAEERLTVLDLVLDISGLDEHDVALISELRTDDAQSRTAMSHKIFRAFYDLRRSKSELADRQEQAS